MQMPIETKPAFWGFVCGAVALAVVGFSWGGWTTGRTAEAAARIRVDEAVIAALAPMCVDKFQQSTGAASALVELRKAPSWSQGDIVEKGGWAMLPGTRSPQQVSAVARSCAVLLTSAV
jgi:hypothetical protein